MKIQHITNKGYNYVVIHLYSENNYGRKSHYVVLTNNPKWCGSLIPDLCGYPDTPSKGEHELRYKHNPSPLTAMEAYYELDLVEDDSYKNFELPNVDVDKDCYYSFTYIEPYDD